jgi:hypothetical protein
MGRAYMKQPNGKYAIWSTVVDDFICLDATWDEVVELEKQDAIDRVVRDMERIAVGVEATGTSSRVGNSWESCLARVRMLHGDKKAALRMRYEFEKEEETG